MEALITSFIAALVSGFGEPAPGGRRHFSLSVFLGYALAAAAVSLVAGFAGHLIHPMITTAALSLLVALALGYAGIAALIQPKPDEARLETGAAGFYRSFFEAAVRESGGRASFIIFALAARFDAPIIAGAGGAAGLIASAAAVGLIDEARSRPFSRRPIRVAAGAAFLLCGMIVGLAARGLI